MSKLRWLGTQGVNFILNTWYSKQAMFWLPQGWVPYQVEWILSFPKAPLGSISVNVWGIACSSVIVLVTQAIASLWALRITAGKAGVSKAEPTEVDQKASASKKEL